MTCYILKRRNELLAWGHKIAGIVAQRQDVNISTISNRGAIETNAIFTTKRQRESYSRNMRNSGTQKCDLR
ncbi:hypothetical protein E2C01_055948 [Portunus trituberculatus]|uniref:Uncharacterized protein n=1 Tax=Portunus trituberculatus TaxID=210409 RepID=A0A5B7GP32_PORTR|nr:hypothetical protein [Portunus trituberculatus]